MTIRLYGFVHPTYILPTFLTARVFSLELIRQRLIVEEEHFLNFKKSSNLIFPWEVRPYTVRSRAALPLVTNLLIGMEFSLGQAVNYDPHQIISKRRKAHKCRPFEHTEIPELREAANWDDFPNPASMDTSIEQSTGSQLPGINSSQREVAKVVSIAGGVSSLVSYSASSIKRGGLEPMDTKEVDMASMPKRQKIEQGQKVVQVKKG